MRLAVHVRDVVAVSPDGDAARVGVLDDGDGRRVAVVVRRTVGGVGVDVVVVRHRLAVQLLPLGDAGLTLSGVQRRALVRVLAVAQARGLRERRAHPFGELIARRLVVRTGEVLPHPRRDGDVVRRGVDERLTRELGALLQREAATVDGGDDVVVARRVGDDRDGGVVLRGRAHHRRAADVDLFDALVDARAGRDGLGERVQVDDDEVERCDAELTQLRQVVVLARVGEDARVHLGVQRLDATLEALGKTGQLLDGRHRDAETGDELARTTGRDDLDAGVGQGACQLLQTRLVVHRDEGPLDGAQTVTH